MTHILLRLLRHFGKFLLFPNFYVENFSVPQHIFVSLCFSIKSAWHINIFKHIILVYSSITSRVFNLRHSCPLSLALYICVFYFTFNADGRRFSRFHSAFGALVVVVVVVISICYFLYVAILTKITLRPPLHFPLSTFPNCCTVVCCPTPLALVIVVIILFYKLLHFLVNLTDF